VKIAGNLPGAAQDRFADHRCRDHLAVEDDGERLAHVLLGRFGEFPRADRIEAEADDRLAVALVEARLRVDQIAAGDENALLDEIFPLPFLAFEDLGVRRHLAGHRLLRRLRQVEHAEIKLRRLADELLEPRRVRQARDLDKNAVGPLALDRGLDQAELVHAPLDDLDRLVDRLANAFDDRHVRRRERDQAAALINLDAALSGAAENAGQRLRKFAQLLECKRNVAFARDAHLDAVAVDRPAGEENPRLTQNAQHVVVDAQQPVLAHRIGVDLEEQARSTLQVETEHDVALRPGRPLADHVFRKEVRYCEQAHDERREQDTRRLPPREKQHGFGRPRFPSLPSRASGRGNGGGD